MMKEKGLPFIEKNAGSVPTLTGIDLTQLFNCINKFDFQRYE